MKKLVFILIFMFSFNVYASVSTIVMDVDSGRILYENNAYEKKLIASTTKIMTFVVAYQYANNFLDVWVEAGDEVLKMYGTSIYLSYKEEMLLRDLLYGLMLRSGNDAASVIANFVGGNEEKFVSLMNRKAQVIGMNNTTFANPHGLDENTQNYSTAYDMALLSCYANQIPFYQKVTSTKYYNASTKIKAYSWTNRNKMVFMYPNFVSGKTGYTPKAGKTFVSSAEKDGLHLTIVTLNDDHHYERHRALYEEYFQKYQKVLLLSKNNFTLNYPNMYIKNDLYYPLTEDEIEKISIEVNLNGGKMNDTGQIVVNLDGKKIIEEKVYQKEEYQENKSFSLLKKVKEFFVNLF